MTTLDSITAALIDSEYRRSLRRIHRHLPDSGLPQPVTDVYEPVTGSTLSDLTFLHEMQASNQPTQYRLIRSSLAEVFLLEKGRASLDAMTQARKSGRFCGKTHLEHYGDLQSTRDKTLWKEKCSQWARASRAIFARPTQRLIDDLSRATRKLGMTLDEYYRTFLGAKKSAARAAEQLSNSTQDTPLTACGREARLAVEEQLTSKIPELCKRLRKDLEIPVEIYESDTGEEVNYRDNGKMVSKVFLPMRYGAHSLATAFHELGHAFFTMAPRKGRLPRLAANLDLHLNECGAALLESAFPHPVIRDYLLPSLDASLTDAYDWTCQRLFRLRTLLPGALIVLSDNALIRGASHIEIESSFAGVIRDINPDYEGVEEIGAAYWGMRFGLPLIQPSGYVFAHTGREFFNRLLAAHGTGKTPFPHPLSAGWRQARAIFGRVSTVGGLQRVIRKALP